MKEKLTLYVDKDLKNKAKIWLKESSFSSLSAFVEYAFIQLDKSHVHQKKEVTSWLGVMGSEQQLRNQAKSDDRLAALLSKHCKK